jgi:hypothetical protein
MYPELENISIWRFVLEIAKWAGIFVVLRILYRLSVEYNTLEFISNICAKYV